MITLREGNLEHHFEDGWLASKYDEWPFYKEHFQGALGGNKAVDVVAQDPSVKVVDAHPLVVELGSTVLPWAISTTTTTTTTP